MGLLNQKYAVSHSILCRLALTDSAELLSSATGVQKEAEFAMLTFSKTLRMVILII